MLRYTLFCGLALSLIIGCGAFAEAMPPAFPAPCPPRQACAPSPPPITRTVHVDVPAPCPPPPCGYRHPCGPPTCAPPRPIRPVQVNVDIRVRPEPCGKSSPGYREECRDPGALRPVLSGLCKALTLPIRLLERICPPSPPCLPTLSGRAPVPTYGKPYCRPPLHWGAHAIRKCRPPASDRCAIPAYAPSSGFSGGIR